VLVEDMRVRGFNEHTRRDYVRHVRAFAAFIGRSPDTATAEDLRLFQLHQTRIGMQPQSINSAVSALRFFFTVTLDRPDLARRLTVVPQPRRIPAVLSVEEVTRSMSIGYTLSIGTPSAISANSRLGVPAATSSSMRAPRNFATSQNSTQLFGCLPSGNASLF
jgi:site-specific recombinase XerD